MAAEPGLDPARQEFDDWMAHPWTRKLREWAQRQKQVRMEQWAAGTFTYQEHFGTAIKNAEAIGECGVFSRLIDLPDEFEDIRNDDGQS